MHHFRSTHRHYAKHNKGDKNRIVNCPFPSCDGMGIVQIPLFENETMYVIPNRVSYDTFESLRVEEHLMVIPKRHLESFSEFSDAERLDMMSIVADYEERGYSVYARGVGSIHRSVKHQHTHLIKLKNKRAKALLYLRKPYIVFYK